MNISRNVAVVFVNEILSPPLYLVNLYYQCIQIYLFIFAYICLLCPMTILNFLLGKIIFILFSVRDLFRLSKYTMRLPLIIFFFKNYCLMQVSRNVLNNNVKSEYYFLFYFCNVRSYIIYHFCFSRFFS